MVESRQNFKYLYIHEAFQFFADGMMMLAIPVFIYQTFGSVSSVFLWYLCWGSVQVVAFIGAFNRAMLSKNPVRWMITGTALYFVSVILLAISSSGNETALVASGVTMGLYIAFYWPVRHWYISISARQGTVGSQISNLVSIRIVIGIIAPLCAGFIGAHFGAEAVYGCAAIALALGALPLLKLESPQNRKPYSIGDIKRTINQPYMKNLGPVWLSEAAYYTFLGIGWVLLLSVVLGGIEKLGIVIAGSAFIALILSKLVGRLFDREKRREVLQAAICGRALAASICPLILIVKIPAFVMGITTLNYFAGTMFRTAYEAYLYSYGKLDPVGFFLVRELYLGVARLILNLAMVVVFSGVAAEYLWIAVLFGGASVVGAIALKSNDHLLVPVEPVNPLKPQRV